jgi:exodeoxyribonuclease VII small subunit
MSNKKSNKNSEPATAEATDDLADVSFETALVELESLVERMEAGDLSLEDSLAAFERGVKLTRHCQSALKNAELKVKVLTEENALEDLDLDTIDDT